MTGKQQLAFFGLFLILALALWVVPWPTEYHILGSVVHYGLAFVLLWVLPGLAWAALIPRHALGGLAWLAVGLGLSFVVTPITILLLVYLPGPLTEGQLLVALGGAVVLPLGLSELWRLARHRRRPSPFAARRTASGLQGAGEPNPQPPILPEQSLRKQRGWTWLLFPLIIAAGMRGIHLDYSQFQGDEAIVAVSAARVLEGDDSAVFRLKKGPGELAVVAGTWRLTGILNEWMARLPFAWANLLGLVAVYLFCQRLERPALGAVAVGLLAIEGYLVAFGRIVQYQSVVFALTSLGVLCLALYYKSGNASLILAGAALFAAALLAHYDALLALPAGLVFVTARLWKPGPDREQWNRVQAVRAVIPILLALMLGLAIAALFYVPFLQSPFVERTSSYVSRRVGSSFFNNLRSTFILSSVYNSVYYLALMLSSLAVSLYTTWSQWGRAGAWAVAVLLAAVATALVRPELWAVGGVPWAWLPFALMLVGALLAPKQTVAQRALWVWFAVPSLVYLFFVADPLTHVHTFFVPWAILAGMGLLRAAGCVQPRPKAVRWAAAAAGVALYLLCANYAALLFVDHNPEYLRTFPESKSPLYWTPYSQIPERGLFGFPYQAGWKVAGVQMDQGLLGTNYRSNEEPAITDYYTRQAARWNCPTPDLYITADHVQDEVPIRWDQVASDYQPAVIATVGGQPRLVIHTRHAGGAAVTAAAEEAAPSFDSTMTPDRLAGPVPRSRPANPAQTEPLDVSVGNWARLTGYHLNTDHAIPGGYVDLTLIWQAVAPSPTAYTVFTHLDTENAMQGQLDSQPVCGRRPTTAWQAGEEIVDPYRIPVRADAQPGPAQVTVGLYDSATRERLALSAADGSPIGDSLLLAEFVIREP